jgi:hypothetical protein
MSRLTTSQERLIKATLTAKPYPLDLTLFWLRQNVSLLTKGERRRTATG